MEAMLRQATDRMWGVLKFPGTFVLRCFVQQFLFDYVKVIRIYSSFKQTYCLFPDAKQRACSLKRFTVKAFNKIY